MSSGSSGALPLGPLLMLAPLALGCAGLHEAGVRRELSAHPLLERSEGVMSSAHTSQTLTDPGGLSAYLALALEHNPSLRASFERWRASVHRVSQSRQLPEPTLSFGYFVRSVETRVGPQQARVSLQQAFPWPTRLTAAADAASAEARASQRRFDARALTVSAGVATAYWTLWQVRALHRLHARHLDVMRALSATARARVATGATTLADQQQIDLTAARVEDAVASLAEDERSAEARLRAAVGSAAGLTSLPTPEAPPDATLPIDSEEVLALAVRSHPDLAARDFSAEARESKARAEEANALPSFSVGADWIITGRAEGAGPADSGKDAVMVGAGVRLPVWQGTYADAADAARAEAHVERADKRAATDRALSELASSLSDVRDAARRVHLYTYTLLPQAESAYSSILGAYASGRGSVAQALLSQRDLLELRIARVRARADHARAWARLEQVTGKPLERRSTPPLEPSPDESEP